MAGHSHGCGAEACDHDHDSENDRGSLYSLYLKIDTEKVQCLNEVTDGSGKYVFKPWDQRLDKEKVWLHIIAHRYFLFNLVNLDLVLVLDD